MPKSPEETLDAVEETPVPTLEVQQKPETVRVTVTKFGDGKISTGEHVSAHGDVKAKRGDTLTVSLSIAEALEKRGLAEIV